MMKPPRPEEEDIGMEKLSREELKKIQKSMKRPEFMGLLNQYMVEISDPKNKNQYDEYLQQMEREGELPKHMKLVKLTPQFCFRTQIVSTKNKKHQMKFFINMCSSEYIEKPACEPGPQGNGFNWKIPNSMGKIRYDQDVHKNPCQVVDCAFHPDTFKFCMHASFQAMVIGIALESAEKQLGERKQTLSRDYVILKKLKCKSQNGQPALLPIRYIDGKAYNRGEGPAEFERDLQGKETKLQKQINKQKEEYKSEKQKQERKKEKEKADKQQEEQDLQDEGKKKLIEDLEQGIHAPKYTSIYTYKTDYSEFIDGPVHKKTRKLPNTFTIQFKVPRMENISEASQLEINENKIIFGVQGKYYIDLSFEDVRAHKYPLKTAEAKAKFDKKKKVLKIAIPVDIDNLPQEPEPEQIEQQSKIIQNETWKNKVLQLGEQNVQTKFIEQSEMKAEPEKKLVQEIDEDDVEQDKKNVDKEEQNQKKKGIESQEQSEEDEIKEKQYEEGLDINGERHLFGKNFTLRPYYNDEQPGHKYMNKNVEPISVYTYRLSFNKKQAIITVPLRNYHSQDLQAASANGQMILLWKKTNRALHFCIRKQMFTQWKEIKVIKRVGFCAFVIDLINQKNQQIDFEMLINNFLENEQWREWENFHQNIQTIEKAMQEEKERKLVQKQQEQRKLKELKQNEQTGPKQITSSQQKTVIQDKSSKMQQIDEEIKQKGQNMNKTEVERNIFQKIPVQFIRFNASFVETLN